MTEKRFELKMNGNGQLDIVDWIESKEKNVICIYNDLGVLPFSSANQLCDLLNELYEENQLIKKNIREFYKFVKIDVDNEIEVYPKALLENIVNILKIIGDLNE